MKLYIMFLIADIIKNGNSKTAKELGDELEISPRSVLRYINELEVIGFPIDRVRGRNGGFVIKEKYSLNFSVLTKNQQLKLIELLEKDESIEAKQILTILNLA